MKKPTRLAGVPGKALPLAGLPPPLVRSLPGGAWMVCCGPALQVLPLADQPVRFLAPFTMTGRTRLTGIS